MQLCVILDTCSEMIREFSRYNKDKPNKEFSDVIIKPSKYQTFSSFLPGNSVTVIFAVDRSCKGMYYGKDECETEMEYKKGKCEIKFKEQSVVWTRKSCKD